MVQDQENQRARRVDVGGYALRMRVIGEGDPTIVFDSGLGDALEIWDSVQPEIAKQARTVLYDRAGIGKSDPGPHPRSAYCMVEELRLMLRAADIRPPFVLVGHSMAGFTLRVFAHNRPEEVAGLVFVDASHEDLMSRWEAARTPEEWSGFQEKMEGVYKNAPEGELAEWRHFPQNAASMREIGPPPDVPIAFLTSTRLDEASASVGITEEDMQAKLDLHREWLVQAPQATHTVTEASGHYIQQDEPDLVIDAIRGVLWAVELGNRSAKAFCGN
jgi:pimeloyl-ACP methyl ester carboxylesterase